MNFFKIVIAYFALFISYLYANESIRLNDSVISTTGFDTLVREESRNVTVVTKDSIENRGYINLSEILKKSPYLTITPNTTGTGNIIDLRGQGKNAIDNVKILIDEVPISILDNSHNSPPIDTIAPSYIEQIEILPGGGSVLYGNGASGGTINIITKANKKKNYSDTQVLYRSFNTVLSNAGFGYNATDALYFNMDYTFQDGEGYRNKEELTYKNFATALSYSLTDKQELAFSFRLYDDEGQNSTGLTKQQLEANRTQEGDVSTFNNTKADYSLKYNYKITDSLEFKANAYYQDLKGYIYSNSTYVVPPRPGQRPMVLNFNMDGDFEETKKGISLRQKYSYSDEDGHFIFGYDYIQNNLDRTSTTANSLIMDGYTENNLSKNTHSFFVADKYVIGNVMELSGGYRWEGATYNINRFRDPVPSMIAPNNNNATIDSNKKEINYATQAGLSILLSDFSNIYLNYERGFMSPNPNQLTNSIDNQYVLNDLQSQTSNTYEFGYKDYYLATKTFITLTTFYTITKDEIQSSINTSHTSWEYYNLAETTRKGVELFLEHQITNSLTFNESASYIDAKITEGQFTGNTVPYVPKTKYTVGAKYEIIENLNLMADLTYTNSYNIKAGTTRNPVYVDSPATIITDASMSYKAWKGLSVLAGVNNLFNKEYDIPQITMTNTLLYIPTSGRTYYAGLRYNF